MECDDEENFILGYVNEKKFTKPEELVKELKKYDILVNFNGWRFDNEILRKYCPNDFLEIKNANFSAFNLNGKLTIDLYSMISIIIGLENYSAEGLAKQNKFEEEILGYEEDKDLKCQQDIRILKFLWEKYDIPKVFNTISTLANLDTTLMQIIRGERLRKWILINKYIRRGFLPLKTNKARSDKVDLGVVKYAKIGLYENYKYLDVSSTYPQTAINLGNLGIYDNDKTFSELQNELFKLSKDEQLKPFLKSISNALCGSMYSQNEYWRNDDIFEKIVKTVASKVKEVLDKREDCIYVNTDCWIVPIKSPDIKLEGYKVKTDYEFKFLYIFNNNKWLGLTKDRVEFRGFRKLNTRSPKILHIAREEILKKLFKAEDKEEFKELLDDSEELVKKTIKELKKYPKEYFKIVVRKKDDYCRDLNLMSIWKELKVGFNEIFYNEKGEYTIKFDNKNYKYYEGLILELAEEYSTMIE